MGTNLISLDNVQLPAYLKNAPISAVTEDALAGLSTFTAHPRISIRAARFRIIEDSVETVLDTLTLSATIVGANKLAKQYYSVKYDPDTPVAPDCWSDSGEVPDPAAENKQCANCAACPMNQWGSSKTPSGEDGKACSDLKRLAVVSSDDVAGTVYELQVPPSALKNFKEYARKLAQRKIPIEAAVTVMGFDPDASFPKLVFSFGGLLSQADYEAAAGVAASDIIADIVRKSAPIDEFSTPKTVAAPQPVKAVEAPKPAPKKPAAPKPVPKVEEPAPEPEPVAQAAPAAKGFGKASVPAAKGFGKAAPAQPAEREINPRPAAPAASNADLDSTIADLEAELNAFSAAAS